MRFSLRNMMIAVTLSAIFLYGCSMMHYTSYETTQRGDLGYITHTATVKRLTGLGYWLELRNTVSVSKDWNGNAVAREVIFNKHYHFDGTKQTRIWNARKHYSK